MNRSQRAVARMSQQGGPKITRGGHIFKYNIRCMQQPPRKKSLATCKLYSHLTRPRKLYRYERRTCWAPSFDVIWQRSSIFCKPLKLLSPCRLSSIFTFAPRLLFHVARATAYQAVRYTTEIMQIGDTTWQLKHKSRKNVILRTSPNRTNFVKYWFWLISGNNIPLLPVTLKSFGIPRAGSSGSDAPSRLIQL